MFPLCLVLGFGVPAAIVIGMAGAPWFASVLLCAVIALAGLLEQRFEGEKGG